MSGAETPPREPRLRGLGSGHAARIVVAEDDAEVRWLVVTSLRQEGYDVVEECDGGRLLVRLGACYGKDRQTDPIDLIVSDINMPVCTGLDILKGLRDAHWTTPVILMTAMFDAHVRGRAERLGAIVLSKPFPLATLHATVRAMLPARSVA